MSGKHTSGSHLAPASRSASKPAAKAARPPKQKKKSKRLWIALGVLGGLVVILVLAGYFVFSYAYGSMNVQTDVNVSPSYSPAELDALLFDEGEEEEAEDAEVLSPEEIAALEQEMADNALREELMGSDDVYNILLLGNDSRSNNINERTDVMLLVSVNKANQQIILTSFLRDLYVYIPGYFSHRLNSANSLGGPSLTVSTIEQNFGIDIDNYAEVNFYAFIDIVDILGGVDIDLSSAEAQVVGCGSSSGTYHLNGEQALAYCRIRKLDNDFGRTERQRKLLNALWSGLKGASLSEAASLMDSVLPYVTTNLDQKDCLNLLTLATQIFDYKIYSTSIPADGTWTNAMIDGMAVLRADLDANYDHLYYYIYS